MTDEQLATLINATIGGQANTERLIRIEEKLSNHLDNCHEAKSNIERHIKESIDIRDSVKANTGFRKGATKALWVIYGSLVCIVGKILFFK